MDKYVIRYIGFEYINSDMVWFSVIVRSFAF